MRHTAFLALGAGILLSGFSPILVRMSPVDPGATAFWRLAMAALLMLIFARFRVRLPLKVIGAVAAAGFLLAADLVLWNMAIVSTTVLEATLLVMLYPLLVAAAEIFWLKRPLGWPLIVGGLIAFSGAAVMTLGPTAGQSSLYGNALALIAAFFYARVIVLMFFSEPTEDTASVVVPSAFTTIALAAAATVTIVLGIVPQPVLELVSNADVFIR